MDPDTGERSSRSRHGRPPSSYGSMKSEESEDEVDIPLRSPSPGEATPRVSSGHQNGGMIRCGSPETLYSATTDLTKPPGAFVIDTRLYEQECIEEYDGEVLITNSPEPPEPIESETAEETDAIQPGRLHPQQDLAHVFSSIMASLSGLNEELYKYKMWFHQWEPELNLRQITDGDILDFVDKLIETLGVGTSLSHTIKALESFNMAKADELREKCKRALIRHHLTKALIRKHQVIREGVVQAGKHNNLDVVYVEPEISTVVSGALDPTHEYRTHSPPPPQQANADTSVCLNNLFRLQKSDGQPVRTVLTTGLPGIGLNVSVGKYCFDWAQQRANKDFQFVIKLSFSDLWLLRKKHLPPSEKISIMEVIEYYHPECKDMAVLEEVDCKFLIVMHSYDSYQTPLDWLTAPVIDSISTPAHPDVLIVNIIRGTLLPGACVWILGRQAAVSQIPSEFIDVYTEIRGFSEEMRDDYFRKRFPPELSEKIMAHYKQLPTLQILSRLPFACWIMATVFEARFRCRGYGVHPPKLTPFFVNFMIIQMNRRLQFYCERSETDKQWLREDTELLRNMGKMAFQMLEMNRSLFFEEDLEEFGLRLSEVTIFSGLCTELPRPSPEDRRQFCFIHFTVQEFMAALYVFTMFRTESENILDQAPAKFSRMFPSKSKSAAGLVQSALQLMLASPLGHYDMFLRFLCGLLSPNCHEAQLGGYLYPRNCAKLSGLGEVQELLTRSTHEVPEDRVENVKECLRELIQEDD
ncbi:NLR family CARD domain-containing protein 3 isoform X1 [Synchiropus splendidus]|uniref:NLR family CARD domain-containing protein 3 isoform X1 n=1 Tax=Synchiropus splendidus TaxID=270530 RepID=UPI00237E82BE|nr:NLR family CARD domain-containing protein 3 isoform X1 [Synchiropus splendidus]